MTEQATDPYDLSVMSDEERQRLLRASTPTGHPLLYVGQDIHSSSDIPFLRVRLTDTFLKVVGISQEVNRLTDKVENEAWRYSKAPGDRAEITAANGDPSYSWTLHTSTAGFWFTAKVMKLPVGYDVRFTSMLISTRKLMQRLESGLADADEATALGHFDFVVDHHLLTSSEPNGFVEVVSAYMPEVAAAMTASAMRARVAETVAVKVAVKVDAAETAPAARRRRLGV
jgi:hypothetical protein